LDEAMQERVLGPLGLDNTSDPGGPMIPEPVLHAYDSEQRGVYSIPASLPFYAESTYWDTSWSLAKGTIQVSNIFDLDATAIAVGNGTLLSPESHDLMVSKAQQGFGGPTAACPECHRGDAEYTYGMGVVMTGDWLLQDPLVNGYAALEAYLPSQRIAISLVVTLEPEAFDTTTGSYHNRGPDLFRRIATLMAPDDAPPAPAAPAPPPPGG
jgi:hypothetical protein